MGYTDNSFAEKLAIGYLDDPRAFRKLERAGNGSDISDSDITFAIYLNGRGFKSTAI